MKLVYTPLNVSFLKTLVTNLTFFSKYFHIKKGKRLFYFSLNWKFYVLMFFNYILKKKLRMFWHPHTKKRKLRIHISFVINRLKIFQAIFQPITFMITKKNISQCRSWKRTHSNSVNLAIIFVIKQNDRFF